jgi:hypothetical protein
MASATDIALPPATQPAIITPAQLWPDADTGEHINAHCGCITQVGNLYYWFGEYRAARRVQQISCYVSADLQHWKPDHIVLTGDTTPDVANSHLERPKVIYNDKTKKYVMWIHRENTRGYADAQCAVATCDKIDGDYTWQGAFRPNGNMSRDCTLFKDDDGSAYFMSSSRDNADMIVYKLTDDYLKVDSQVIVLSANMYREAPCMFKRNGIYYLITSFCTGTWPNTQTYITARSMAGPWSPPHKLSGDDTWNTYYSQGACILTVQGSAATSYIYCADRWQVMPMRHIWLPMQFNEDGSIIPLRWADSWSLDAATGKFTLPDPVPPLVKNLALGAVVTSDYEPGDAPLRNVGDAGYSHLANHEPSAGNDGNAKTSWIANDNQPGHWFKLDLGGAHDLSGSEITWHRNTRGFRYRIDASPDDQNWTTVADHTAPLPRTERPATRPATTRSATSIPTQPNPTVVDRFNAAGMRYVRVTITAIPSGYDWPGLAELKVFGDGQDIAAGKPATADSFQPNTLAPAAVDGNPATAWVIDDRSANHWLKLDLGKPTDIGGCRIHWEAPGFWYQYKVETSADDKSWALAVDETKNAKVDSYPMHSFASTGVRFVRLTITGFERGCWPGVRELEVMPAK